jgi:hypothetical protein
MRGRQGQNELNQGCGFGSRLDPDPNSSVGPDPGGQK